MIELKKGNFFDYKADIRINTVNCVGVMGAGVALQFKNMYPKMFLEYKDLCSRKGLTPGNLHIWNSDDIFNPITIINFPTKDNWKNPSEYSYIKDGLESLFNFLKTQKDKTITLPALGCGHGGLDWNVIRPMIFEKLSALPLKILLFEPESSQNVPLNNSDVLQEQNIQALEPNQNEFPLKLKGKSARTFFYIGNIELLNGKTKILNIVSSKNPTDKEKSVLFEILNELKNYEEIAILLRGDKSYELDIFKFALEKEIRTIINPSKGLLNFKIRKDILTSLNDSNYLVYSSIKNQSDSWSVMNFTYNLKESFTISDFVLYNISEVDEIIKSVQNINDNKKLYYINYFKEDIHINNKKFELHKLGRNKDGKPNVFKMVD